MYRSESPVTPWPRTIPCRISDANAPDLLVTTLGDVRTPLAEGVFDPRADRVVLNGGETREHYYRDHLKVEFYAPLDKSIFLLPPSGWCSWYYYYQQVTAEEIKRNAEWLGQHLLEYGARYCQLDDGWQGVGHGLGENRDWTTLDQRFAKGLDDLARYIRAQGLEAGLWLAPHGQSNVEVVEHWDVFLLDEHKQSLSDTWEGKFLLDPTRPRARAYLQDLFRKLCEAGFTYFKIDGQPIVIAEYEKHAAHMAERRQDDACATPDAGATANADATSRENAKRAYRHTLEWIRAAIGRSRYLLGCWGLPLAGAGIMNGSRTSGDIIQGLGGLKLGARAAQRFNYLHNIVWYCDPDVCIVRPPMSIDLARMWATIQGLTGQALLTSDRLPDLPSQRVEILKRVYPAVDIRPLDLFDHGQKLKPFWDLKVAHLGRTYDVVGCFNFEADQRRSMVLNWRALGLKGDALYHMYDFWNREYLGCWEAGYALMMPPASCRVLTLVEAADHPQLVSTDRHITQGWIDLLDVQYDAKQNVYRGRSQLIGGDPYTLTFAFPRAAPTFRVAAVSAPGARVSIANHQGWATVRLDVPRTRKVDWRVVFDPAEVYSFEVDPAPTPTVELTGAFRYRLSWDRPYNNEAGFAVYLDNELLAITPDNELMLRDLARDRTHAVGLRCVWWDGSMSKETALVELPYGFPDELYLSDCEPRALVQGWGSLTSDRSVAGGPPQIGEKVYRKGLGSHAAADIEYDLAEQYERFTAEVGVDQNNGNAETKLSFEVWTDGLLRWQSGVMTSEDPALPVDLEISSVRILRLVVCEEDDGIDFDHADWGEAKVTRNTRLTPLSESDAGHSK